MPTGDRYDSSRNEPETIRAGLPYTRDQALELSEILERRANEIMGFLHEYQKDPKHYGSVKLALSREIDRLHNLASVVRSPFVGREDEE